jgi:hypothetical protein
MGRFHDWVPEKDGLPGVQTSCLSPPGKPAGAHLQVRRMENPSTAASYCPIFRKPRCLSHKGANAICLKNPNTELALNLGTKIPIPIPIPMPLACGFDHLIAVYSAEAKVMMCFINYQRRTTQAIFL